MNAELTSKENSTYTSGSPDVDFLWGLAIGSGECLQRDLTVLNKDFVKKRLSQPQIDALRLQMLNINELAEMLFPSHTSDPDEGQDKSPLRHSERWVHPVTGVGAIISQWRGEDACMKVRDVDVKTASLEECQHDLIRAGFHRCNNL